jgi:2-oxoglutarate/2-oxoacid ferredoxin oxidoreductase subunit alpha
MRKNILICGQAGQGINFTSLLLGWALVKSGFYVFVYRDYESLIRGGHNFNVLSFSDKPIYSHQNKFDVVIDLDGSSSRHRQFFNKKIIILGKEAFDLKDKVEMGSVNNYLLGVLWKKWGLELKYLVQGFKKELKIWQKAVGDAKEGYASVEADEILKAKTGKDKFFFTGTRGVVMGSLFSGLDIYLSYPMTPATGVLIELAHLAKKNKMMVCQLEDEVGIVNTALGASYAGATTMVGTSGGGFALMSEAISLSGIAEVPLVVYLSQRAGPSTGVPTHTGQGDLGFSLFAGSGEFPRVVVAPGNPEEAISRTSEALFLANKYRLPVILLSDKHLSESYYTFDQLNHSKVKADRFIVKNPSPNYLSYGGRNFPSRIVPGQGAWARANSYEHDQTGFTVEDAGSIAKMNEQRMKKLRAVESLVSKWEPAKVHGRGSNLIVSWGSTQGAIRDSLSDLKDYRFLQISYLDPFPKEIVSREIKKSKKVILVENNLTGLLGRIIAMETGHIISKKILKYDGRPFTAQEIINEIKKIS